MRTIRSSTNVFVSSIIGGDKDNAIPRDCSLVFAVAKGADISAEINKAESMIRHGLCDDDKNFALAVEKTAEQLPLMDKAASDKLIYFLTMFCSGPVMMSPDIAGLVETSYNLAIIRASADGVKITVTSRSSVEESLDDMEQKMQAIGRLAGATVTNRSRYPGWKYAEVSPMRDAYLKAYKNLFGADGIAIGIHAGLECGLLMQRVPDMDIISIGPDIKDLHSPSETLGIASLDRLYDIVLAILAE